MRRIRVLIATLGLDQHELGAMAVSRMLRDAGMEVIYGGRFNLPPMLLRMAEEEDVDVIGLSCHSWEYIHYVPELCDLLRENGLDIPVVIGGSVITAADAEMLKEKGVAAVFGPSARGEEIVEAVKTLGSRAHG
jgi:methylmalonyl-CoA mutase C-terminal domain/subunit